MKLTQEQLALEIGVTRSAVANWEGGLEPTLGNLIAIAVRCGVSIEWLATGRGAMVLGAPLISDEPGVYRSPPSAEEWETLDAYRRLKATDRAHFDALIRRMARLPARSPAQPGA